MPKAPTAKLETGGSQAKNLRDTGERQMGDKREKSGRQVEHKRKIPQGIRRQTGNKCKTMRPKLTPDWETVGEKCHAAQSIRSILGEHTERRACAQESKHGGRNKIMAHACSLFNKVRTPYCMGRPYRYNELVNQKLENAVGKCKDISTFPIAQFSLPS